MKLLTRYYRIYLIITIPLLSLVSVGFYFLLLKVITDKADEVLLEDKHFIISEMQNKGELMDLFLNLSDDYQLRLSNSSMEMRDQFSTIMIYDELEKEDEPYRQLYCFIRHEGETYELTIRKSLVEYNSIMYSILVLGIVFTGLLILGFTLINRTLTRSVWNPFYKTLSKISNYSPDSKMSMLLEPSNIDEFNSLNESVMRMSEKIRNDFIHQKRFIDHVAHEVQTPLSVVNANIENIIQNRNLTKDDYESLQNVSESSSKLSRVVKSLLLLSRIENNQFDESIELDLVELIEDYFESNIDHLNDKRIVFLNNAKRAFMVNMNPSLADVLVSNLCRNAIRHSREDDHIWLDIVKKDSDVILTLSNNSLIQLSNSDKLFKLFQKHSDHPDSMGIGLSIVKEICLRYKIDIKYEIEGTLHQLKLII